MPLRIGQHITTADVISLANALLGFAAVLMIVMGFLDIAVFAMFIAAVADYFDGRIARSTGTNKEWGKEIDSLCDIVAFGVAPAFLAWTVITLGLASFSITLALVAGFAFPAMLIVAGILRLTRYNISTMQGLYVGMPITLNGVIFPVLWIATGGLSTDIMAVVMATACLVSAVLMVSNFIIRKR